MGEPSVLDVTPAPEPPPPDVFGWDDAGATYPSDVLPETQYVETAPAATGDTLPGDLPVTPSSFDAASLFKTIAAPLSKIVSSSLARNITGSFIQRPTFASTSGGGPGALPNRNPYVLPGTSFFRAITTGAKSATSSFNPTLLLWGAIGVVVLFILMRRK